MSAVSMDFTVLRIRDALEVRDVVVERIVVLVVDEIAIRDGAIVVLPDRDMECDFLAIPVVAPSPEVDPPVPLLGTGVTVVLPAVEDDRLGVLIAIVHSSADCFCR